MLNTTHVNVAPKILLNGPLGGDFLGLLALGLIRHGSSYILQRCPCEGESHMQHPAAGWTWHGHRLCGSMAHPCGREDAWQSAGLPGGLPGRIAGAVCSK